MHKSPPCSRMIYLTFVELSSFCSSQMYSYLPVLNKATHTYGVAVNVQLHVLPLYTHLMFSGIQWIGDWSCLTVGSEAVRNNVTNDNANRNRSIQPTVLVSNRTEEHIHCNHKGLLDRYLNLEKRA
jgi:hypothetical protein